MFVQSEKFVDAHGGRVGDIYVFGQESNHTTWRLAKMNLAIRGIDGNLGPEHADTFHRDLHPDLKADYVLANPPFNDSDWRGELLRDDKRWQYGAPPAGNANFAWVQHFIHHLAPAGMAGFVLANGSMSSNQSGEGEIRKAIIEADLVDCMVALPGQLFYSTQIPVCLWFLRRDKRHLPSPAGRGVGGEVRDRRGEMLFIDARKLGAMTDRVHRELTDDDIARIAGTYHAWRGDLTPGRTDQALLQLIDSAQATLHIVSFAVYRIEAIAQALARAAGRGVAISLYLETPDASEGRIAYNTLAAFGAAVRQHAHIYIWPLEKRPRSDDGRHGSLHAKVAIADGRVMLISSANLTEYAMTLNMELGVMINGGASPERVAEHLERLVEQGTLRRVEL